MVISLFMFWDSMKRFGMLFWLLAYGVILFVASCAPIVKTNGEILPDDKLQSLRVGVLKKEDVRSLLGTPTTISTFDPNIWHYMGQKVEQQPFGGPKRLEQKIVIVSFDDQGVLDAFVMRGTDAYREISYESQATPTAGHKLSAIEQLLGNYGRLSSLPNEKETTR
jgi:outer membrane protein assembly factor BamE (lipoprotein component of BamABCDE complex)